MSQEDKFCYVVVPKQNLRGVDLEIINTKTQEKVSLGKGVIYNVSSKPNTNCLDLSSDGKSIPGSLNLDQGVYQFRFLLNHQALKNIQFEIK